MIYYNTKIPEYYNSVYIYKPGNIINNACLKTSIFAFLLPLFFFTIIISCSETPSLADIEQLNDRTPPLIYIENWIDGEIYEDFMRIKGKVIDEQRDDNQAVRIKIVTYCINGNEQEIEIPIDTDGSFLVSFSTHHYSGSITICFKATDISGNTGIKSLTFPESPQLTSTPEPSLTPNPESTAARAPGTVWFEPDNITVSRGDSFIAELHINSGTQSLAAYLFTIYYNFYFISLDTSTIYNGIDPGPDGFISAVNINTNGTLTLSGFDASGATPGTDLYFLSSYWKAEARGTTFLSISIAQLVDITTKIIGEPTAQNCTITIQ